MFRVCSECIWLDYSLNLSESIAGARGDTTKTYRPTVKSQASLYTRRANKKYPHYNLLLITHQWFKLILQYSARVIYFLRL